MAIQRKMVNHRKIANSLGFIFTFIACFLKSEGDEAVNPESEGVDPNVLVNVEGQVDAIMNEIIQDEEWRNLLNAEIEDEGIEITPDDDIVFDIDPFDFALEVELYEW